MTITLSHTFVTVTDYEEALAFYRDTLGLEVVNDVPFENFRWVTLSSPTQPGVELVLAAPDMGHSPEDAAAITALLAKGAMNGVIFDVDDVDTTFEKIRATGAEVLQEPIDQPYGVRDFAFRDPSGNHIRFSSGDKA
jgi:catechol 2,3-dioxygenase-like lactoylglutathione lyase family enzyme